MSVTVPYVNVPCGNITKLRALADLAELSYSARGRALLTLAGVCQCRHACQVLIVIPAPP
jgi:hypothetical protein